MTVAEINSKHGKTTDYREPARPLEPLREPGPLRRRNVIPYLITAATVAVAVLFAWAMYGAYMGTPWTRDATVRADVITIAPEVEGRIIDLPLADNQFVRKGDSLLQVDPTNYTIAVRQAEAALRQAQAMVQTIDAQMTVQQAQIVANQAQVDQAQAALVFAEQQAARYQTLAKDGWGSIQNEQQYTSQLRQQQAGLASAQATLKLAQQQIETLKAQRSSAEATIVQAAARLDQARVNLERTRILAPVNAWVTNLLAKPGDYAAAGRNVIAIVEADSFWVDAYFEETQLAGVRPGDPAGITLMGYNQVVPGHVGSIARGINVANATPNSQGLANVNPIFTWVRLAQRIPVRIQIDQVPDGVTLVAGMTATVNIEDRTRPLAGFAALPLVLGVADFGPGAAHP
jgi:multidrug resistance efflux pump